MKFYIGQIVFVIPLGEYRAITKIRNDDFGVPIIEVLLKDDIVYLCRECEISDKTVV